MLDDRLYWSISVVAPPNTHSPYKPNLHDAKQSGMQPGPQASNQPERNRAKCLPRHCCPRRLGQPSLSKTRAFASAPTRSIDDQNLAEKWEGLFEKTSGNIVQARTTPSPENLEIWQAADAVCFDIDCEFVFAEPSVFTSAG